MKWLMSVARIVGASLPFVPSLMQLQTEIDSVAIQRRLLSLEDPISTLHPDIREVSEKLYRELAATGVTNLRFDSAFYTQYSRPLAILEAQGFIVGTHAIGARYVDGLWVQDPKYVVYLCALYEDQSKMDGLVQILESCTPGQRLRGEDIEAELQLPRPVIKALFQLYEARGLGDCSREIGAVSYVARA
ncbi:MAG: hypothetical protein Q8L39_12175 [Burkholderiales bacterium]|nr:hypothetical protein [Burkholderiales bacterium]